MSQIAGLQDFRQEAPPADKGIFQFPFSVMAFQHVFAGTTYVCAIRAGERGWVLVGFGTDARTVLQAGINEGRGELFIRRAAVSYLITGGALTPTATGQTLAGEGMWATVLQLANGANCNLIERTLGAPNILFFTVRDLMLQGNSANNLVSGNGIYITGGATDDVQLLNIYVDDFRERGIDILSWGLRIQGSLFEHNVTDGARIDAGNQVYIYASFFSANTRDGLVILGSNNVIMGSNIYNNGRIGLYVANAPKLTIMGGSIYNNNTLGGNWDALYLVAGDDCVITTVFIDGNNASRYCINISAAAIDDTIIDNVRVKNWALLAINDVGTNTHLPTLVLPFVNGTESITADGAPKGWRVDAATEFAIAYGVMPPDCQQTVRIRVWGVGLAAPGAGNKMLLNIVANAAQPDEVYTGEAISVANKISNEINFAVNDIVSWTLTASDDADVDDLVARDCIEVKAIYNAVVGADIATNALLRCIEIQYI